MKLTLGWWNTHLTPPVGAKEPSAEHLADVYLYLSQLCSSPDFGLVALGEIGPEALAKLALFSWDNDLRLISLEGRDGQQRFDMALVYQPSRIQIADPMFEFDVIAGTKSKVALRLEGILPDGAPVTFFVVHWTSRVREGADTQRRSDIAQSLRRKINDLLDVQDDGKIIVLGDFNDEPYDHSIAKYLEASRDIHRVFARPRLLYNPFWRPLAPNGLMTEGRFPLGNTGSHYYRSGTTHRWHVFDQVLVSSAFIGRSQWFLDEANTYIVDASRGFLSNIESRGNFDHYPILASIERL